MTDDERKIHRMDRNEEKDEQDENYNILTVLGSVLYAV
jgi:hypothetical protein